MMRIGLRHHRIAKESDGTPFEPLLRAADFAKARPLPPAFAQKLSDGINQSNGMDGFVPKVADGSSKVIGSLINTDAQMRYQAYVLPATHPVEIAGVPLRYFWQLEPSGDAAVFAVDEISQDFPLGARISDWSLPGAKPTQYDVVNFYQVSGLFRPMRISHTAAFAAAETACR
jgi:hypothetical protein